MMRSFLTSILFSSAALANSLRPNILLTNDDGWAVANIRAQYDALRGSGFDVVMSAPAQDKSGTGSSTAPPTTLTEPCEYDSCPTGSPPEGFNASDPQAFWVNSFPVDAVRFGISTVAPKFFHSKPDFVVCGFNVGNNVGPAVLTSGTVGAATEATLEGIPAAAFSAPTGSHISYTTLTTDPTSNLTLAARLYSKLTIKFLDRLFDNEGPILPNNVSLNVNYAATTNCSSVDDFRFIFTRITPNASATDVQTCGSDHLPDEKTVVNSGCYASISVFSAPAKGDVDAATQGAVLPKFEGLLSCFTAPSA